MLLPSARTTLRSRQQISLSPSDISQNSRLGLLTTLKSTPETSGEGIRKASGARRSDIRAQFLLEAITVSGIGGVVGILAGAAISFAVCTLADIPATVSPFWVVLGVAIAVGVGLFFGYYPANRAANLDRSSACATSERC